MSYGKVLVTVNPRILKKKERDFNKERDIKLTHALFTGSGVKRDATCALLSNSALNKPRAQ